MARVVFSIELTVDGIADRAIMIADGNKQLEPQVDAFIESYVPITRDKDEVINELTVQVSELRGQLESVQAVVIEKMDIISEKESLIAEKESELLVLRPREELQVEALPINVEEIIP